MSPLAVTRSVVGSLTVHAPAHHPARRASRRPTTAQRKDFRTVPVCGSVRPLASQRDRAGRSTR
ncbi:MAG: hypothetical protein WB473_14105 [Pedococcus sp.]